LCEGFEKVVVGYVVKRLICLMYVEWCFGDLYNATKIINLDLVAKIDREKKLSFFILDTNAAPGAATYTCIIHCTIS